MNSTLMSFSQKVDQKQVPLNIFNIVNEITHLISENDCQNAVFKANQAIP